MQAITFACSILFVILDFAYAQNQDDNGSSLYTRRYENLDIDTILASPRLVTNYVECLLNKKPCAPEGKALKRILPEALRTKCGRCWPSQKEGALKVITSLYFKYPEYYKALREKWDPTGEYNRRFEEYLRDQKFNSIGSNIDAEQGEQAQGSSISINITQRPTRQDDNSSNAQSDSLPEISNRFGNSDSGYEYEAPKDTTLSSTPRPAEGSQAQGTQEQGSQAQPEQPSLSPSPPRRSPNGGNSAKPSSGSSQPGPSSSNSGSNSANVPTSTWSQSNSPQPGLSTTTTYYLKTQNPVLNIINRITMKFTNTAEFIAGMLRGAVPAQKVKRLKADHHRTFCDRLRKTLLSYNKGTTNNHHRH